MKKMYSTMYMEWLQDNYKKVLEAERLYTDKSRKVIGLYVREDELYFVFEDKKDHWVVAVPEHAFFKYQQERITNYQKVYQKAYSKEYNKDRTVMNRIRRAKAVQKLRGRDEE